MSLEPQPQETHVGLRTLFANAYSYGGPKCTLEDVARAFQFKIQSDGSVDQRQLSAHLIGLFKQDSVLEVIRRLPQGENVALLASAIDIAESGTGFRFWGD